MTEWNDLGRSYVAHWKSKEKNLEREFCVVDTHHAVSRVITPPPWMLFHHFHDLPIVYTLTKNLHPRFNCITKSYSLCKSIGELLGQIHRGNPGGLRCLDG